jgi:hypothetical protein
LIDLLLGSDGSWDDTEALLEVILEQSYEIALQITSKGSCVDYEEEDLSGCKIEEV